MSLLEDEQKARDRAKTIANEQVKLTATYANGIALAVFVVGGLAPAFGNRPPDIHPDQWRTLILITATVCLIVSLLLHWLARTALKEMQ